MGFGRGNASLKYPYTSFHKSRQFEEEYVKLDLRRIGMENKNDSPRQIKAKEYLERAFYYEEQGEYQKALEECESAIRTNPGLADAYKLQGVLLEEIGNKEAAVQAYREAVRLDPKMDEPADKLRDLREELKTARLSVLDVSPKGFSTRALAYILDLIIIFVFDLISGFAGGLFVVILILIYFFISGRELTFAEESTQFLNFILGLILTIIYFTLFEWFYGASPGKVLLRMRVVKISGQSLDLKAAFTRGIYRIIDGFVLGLVAYHYMSSSELKQRLGDQKAGTIVVDSREPVIRNRPAWWWFLGAAVVFLAIDFFVSILQAITLLR